jgi:hypothetical protein
MEPRRNALRATLDSLFFAMMFDIEAIIGARRLFAGRLARQAHNWSL